MIPEIALGRDIDAKLRDACDLVERAEMGPDRGQCAEGGHLRRLAAVLGRQLAADASDKLRLAVDDRQHPAQEEQIADLHGFDIGAKRRGRRRKRDAEIPSAAVLRRRLVHRCAPPFAQMCAAIDVQHLPGNVRSLGQEDDRIDDFLNAGNAVHRATTSSGSPSDCPCAAAYRRRRARPC